MRSDRHSPKTIEQILMSNADAVFQFSRGTSGEQTGLRIRAKSILIASILDIFTRFAGHVREYSMQEVGYLLHSYGFEVLLKRFFPSDSETRKGIIYLFYKWMEWLYPPFSYNMLLIGQKQTTLARSNNLVLSEGG